MGWAARPPQPRDARLAAPSAALAGGGATPGYALNSTRSRRCGPTKGVEHNLAADTLAEVIAAAERGIQRIGYTHHLAYSFLRSCGLSL